MNDCLVEVEFGVSVMTGGYSVGKGSKRAFAEERGVVEVDFGVSVMTDGCLVSK